MSIRSLSETAAVAKLNSLEFVTSIEEVAQKLAEWQSQNASLLVPISIPFPTETHILDSCEQPTKLFEARAKWARIEIAKRLEIDVEASNKLSFTMTNKEVWFLGPRPKLDKVSMFAAVQSTPSKFIELMLKKELIEAAAFDPQQTFVIGGFGPSIYLGSTSQAEQRRLHLAEAEFLINSKYKTLICNITTKVFVKKSRSTDSPSSASLFLLTLVKAI
ncbi:hypothetical protein [Deefgea sp. CFH1-16]|uniref:hypothetical protein n=1 Tax=Deefgea sp. CFH1-16 TaxID=2675457 RepID=UPI001940275C|nr:hypothetical protein [Deefgea sp. CFH1-16]